MVVFTSDGAFWLIHFYRNAKESKLMGPGCLRMTNLFSEAELHLLEDVLPHLVGIGTFLEMIGSRHRQTLSANFR